MYLVIFVFTLSNIPLQSAMGCPPLTRHSVSSLASAETDYVDPTSKAPLRPEEPKTDGGKGFHALIGLIKQYLVHVYYVHGTWKFKLLYLFFN